MSDSLPNDAPGSAPTWTSGAKDAVGTANNPVSRVWFTVSHGVINEVYYPSIDNANTRDFGFLVTSGDDFFSEERRDTHHEIFPLDPDMAGVPGYRLVNTCRDGRYRITKLVFADPHRDVLLQKITFEALQGEMADYRLYALLAPHVGNQGFENQAKVSDYKGVPMLFAYREGTVWMALASNAPWRTCSVGYVGSSSDGYQDLKLNKRLTAEHSEAGPGNLSVTGEIDLAACQGSELSFVLVLAFGSNEAEAGLQARASLTEPLDELLDEYCRDWTNLQAQCLSLDGPRRGDFELYRTSIAALVSHEDKRFRGGFVASLSIPWGSARTDDDEIGYHAVWPRDQVETAGAKLATGLADNARATLFYLMSTQEADGHWHQNMWLDGTGFWKAIQTDETAFPILLVDLLRRKAEPGTLDGVDPWPTVRRAAAFLVRNGPMTQQDRWETKGGFSPFSLAVTIAALLISAEMADENDEPEVAAYFRETADYWNANIETWTYVSGTDLAKQCGVDGYYVWIAPLIAGQLGEGWKLGAGTPSDPDPSAAKEDDASEMISPDALALVRFGLREPDDPRVLDTLRVVDATLRHETNTGPGWRRRSRDDYGEGADGAPYEGKNGGIGRCWPMLAGERAHYELVAGNHAEAKRLLEVIARQASDAGMLPEQVWDEADIPEHELVNGRATGSAMPLAWAHAETLKLIRSLHDGAVFDCPPQTVNRYRGGRSVAERLSRTVWREDIRPATLPKGHRLRVELLMPGVVRWKSERDAGETEIVARDTSLGVYAADLSTEELDDGECIHASVIPWDSRNEPSSTGADECSGAIEFSVRIVGQALVN